MFLVLMEECISYHAVTPFARGQHGMQVRFMYISPGESDHYGSISLTFYASTTQLMVQGSYLLWVDEHLPSIYAKVESTYMVNAGNWSTLARKRGIGLRRESCPTHSTRHTCNTILTHLLGTYNCLNTCKHLTVSFLVLTLQSCVL